MGALLGSLTHRSIDGLNFRGIAYFKSFCNGFRIAQQMGLLMKAGGKSQSHNLKCMPGVVFFFFFFFVGEDGAGGSNDHLLEINIIQ
jgi:hypothetical protein